MMEKIREFLVGKEEMSEKIQNFSRYLQEHMPPDSQIDRQSSLGKFLRVMRYYHLVDEICKKSPIPTEYVMALMMVEGQGNPASINENDGGAGLIHFQDETANEYGAKVFTKTKEYKHLYGKKYRPKQGEILDEKVHKPYTLGEMKSFDQRFNPQKSIEMTVKYLTNIRKIVDQYYDKNTSHSSWDKHKSDSSYDFKTLLTLNGFNKGPKNFTKNFESGTHIAGIKRNLDAYRDFFKLTKQCLLSDIPKDKIISKLNERAYERVGQKIPTPKTEIKKSLEKRHEKSFGDFTYERENNEGKEIYSYKIKQSGQSIEKIKNIIVSKYKEQSDEFFTLDANSVVNKDGTPLKADQQIKAGDNVYLIVPSLRDRISEKL